MAKRSQTVAPSTTELPQPSAARDILDDGIVMARALAASAEDENRLALARSVTHLTISAYWDAHQESALADPWPIHDLPSSVDCAELSESVAALAQSMGTAAAELDVMEASYLIGVLYTATMPGRERADFGAYYTPPALCDRLIQMATEAGVDWQSARVLDPFRNAFIIYLISHNHPMAEVLDPARRDIVDGFARGFAGMTEEPVTLDELIEARERLVTEAVGNMPKDHRRFLLSFKASEPDWSLLNVARVEALPAVRWRIENLSRIDPERRKMLRTNWTQH